MLKNIFSLNKVLSKIISPVMRIQKHSQNNKEAKEIGGGIYASSQSIRLFCKRKLNFLTHIQKKLMFYMCLVISLLFLPNVHFVHL